MEILQWPTAVVRVIKSSGSSACRGFLVKKRHPVLLRLLYVSAGKSQHLYTIRERTRNIHRAAQLSNVVQHIENDDRLGLGMVIEND